MIRSWTMIINSRTTCKTHLRQNRFILNAISKVSKNTFYKVLNIFENIKSLWKLLTKSNLLGFSDIWNLIALLLNPLSNQLNWKSLRLAHISVWSIVNPGSKKNSDTQILGETQLGWFRFSKLAIWTIIAGAVHMRF